MAVTIARPALRAAFAERERACARTERLCCLEGDDDDDDDGLDYRCTFLSDVQLRRLSLFSSPSSILHPLSAPFSLRAPNSPTHFLHSKSPAEAEKATHSRTGMGHFDNLTHVVFEQSLGRQWNAWWKSSTGQYCMMIPDSKNVIFIQFLLHPNFTT